MAVADFAERVSSIGMLADALRRELYFYVCAQPGPVGRDQAAAALDIPVHKAKFHLDKLESEGLLTAEFARLTGRTGPGAGRPSKLYRRAADELAVSLPGREYELAGQLMAAAIATSVSTGESAIEALNRAAAEHGRSWGQAASAAKDDLSALDIASRALAEHGYEPHKEGDRVVLANCPFHSLMNTHTEMVCGMNFALVEALADEVDPGSIRCTLEPAEGRCCVVLSAI